MDLLYANGEITSAILSAGGGVRASPSDMKQFDKIHQQYTKVRPTYPVAVYDEIAVDLHAVPADLAVDIACGSGQSIDGLKRIAKKIIGMDIGSNLLADARKRHPDITFVQGCGEAPGLDPEIADLVTIATAFYWMDRAKVVENVSSLLKPHGVFAVYKYDFPWLLDPRNSIVKRHLAEKWDNHRSPRLKNFDHDTPDLIAASRRFEKVRQYTIENHVRMSVSQYVDFMASTSYVSKFVTEEVGNDSYLEGFTEELRRAGGEQLVVNFDITMVVASR